MLSCPSSLQGHSDIPTPITSVLPISPNLIDAYNSRRSVETLGLQVLPPLSFSTCRWPYPGSLTSAYTLYFLASIGLLRKPKRSACIHALPWFIPHPDSLSNICLGRIHGAAPFALCYGLWIWPAPLTEYDPIPNRVGLEFGGISTKFPSGPQSDSHAFCFIGMSLLGTVSGQVRPVCYHTNPPSAYIPKRATGMTTTFQIVR